MIDSNELKSRLGPSEYRKLFRRCGFDINEERGKELSGVLGPSELGEGAEGNFSVDLEKGLVKDWGSTGYKGDIFSVIQDVQGLSFSEALQWVASELGLDVSTLEHEETDSAAKTAGRTSLNSSAPSSRSERSHTPASQDRPSSEPDPVASPEQIQRWHERVMGETDAAKAARSYLTGKREISERVLQSAHIGLAHSPEDYRAKWWIMIPVPGRGPGNSQPIKAVKGFAFDPTTEDWKRNEDGRKIPRNAGEGTLYDLVPEDPFDTALLVCEGELDALSALSEGFNAVTGTAGAATFREDWAKHVARLAPTREHAAIVTFDGDEAGREAAEAVARKLYETGAEVRVASLPDEKDVNDILVEGGPTDLQAHLAQAKDYEPSKTVPTPREDELEESGSGPDRKYEPFPLGALPPPIRDYFRASAEALGEEIPPAMVALPALAVLSGAIGDAVRLELKRSWTEPATLWTVLVAPSGSTKSPAFSHAVRPVFHRESEALDEHEQALQEWKAREDPSPQEKPLRKRYRTGDATPEAVVKILEENPRGVLLARDELGAWIGSFDRYVNGSADLQFWVEVWQGFQASRDRAGEGNTTVDTPAVPVTGTIQPGTLSEKLDEIHFESGFAARLILCSPPTPPKRWTEADVSREVRDGYERILTRLYGEPREQKISLEPGAKSAWVEYYNNANAALETKPEGPAKAVAAKGITHTARLALILHLCRKASGTTDTDEVGAGSMEAAIQIGRWLTSETLRVYHDLGLGEEAVPPVRRFFENLPDQFKTREAKEIAESRDIPARTCDKWLRDLVESTDLEKIKRGLYRKT